MAAFDFPAAPVVGDEFTANGITWQWNGEAWWMARFAAPPPPPSTIQIKRTPTDNNPPPNLSLKPGELAVEMGAPLRLWVGVPPAIDATGKKLLAFMGAGDPYVDITGDTMSGDLKILKVSPSLLLDRSGGGTGSNLIGMLAGVSRWVERLGDNTAESGGNAGSDYVLQGYTDAGAALATPILRGSRATNRLSVAGNPIAPLDIATKQYVDGGGAILSAPFEPGMAFSGLQINGNMEISQENQASSVAVAVNSTKYSCDVWMMNWAMGATATATTAQMPGGTCPGFPISMRLTTAAAATTPASEYAIMQQFYEGTRWNKLQWGKGAAAWPIRVSFWVFTDGVGPYPLTGTVNVRNAASNRSYCAEFQVTAQSVWEFKTVTIPGCPDGVWEIANNNNAANLNFVFAGGPSVRTAPNAWFAGSQFAGTNQSNFFAGVNHSVHITGVTVLPGTQIPTLASYPLVTRRHDQEFPNVQRWFRLFPWSVEGYSGAAQNRITAPHQFPAMRQPPTITRAQVGTHTNIRASDPANFVSVGANAEGEAQVSLESAAAGLVQAINFVERFSTRF